MDGMRQPKRLHATKDSSDSDALDVSDIYNSSSSDGRSDSSSEGSDHAEDASLEESESDEPVHISENLAASISFGALATAQETLGKRKRSNASTPETRKSFPTRALNQPYTNSKALERKAGKRDTRNFTRTSKHAPAELSSKKAVSRKREAIPTKKLDHRDPRFEPLSGPLDEQKIKRNYAFLDTYRNSEISELRAAIRKTKDSEVMEKLKRALLSMESRRKAQDMKEQQQEVLRKFRREESAKVEAGKKPFYLKKADRKKLALEERFKGMEGKQVDRVIERRRKKKTAKERRNMPETRRG